MRNIILICMALLPFAISAQDIKSLEEKILEFDECFRELSHPEPKLVEHPVTGGGIVTVMQRTDYAKQSFLQADPTIDKMSVSIYDIEAADEFGFKEEDINTVFDWTFNAGFAFNVFAHGIVDEEGKSSGVSIDNKDLTPEQLTDLIFNALSDYEIIINTRGNPYPIILHSCSCAKEGEDSYAARLSRLVAKKMPNAYIIAAQGPVVLSYNGGKYDESVRTSKDGATIPWTIFHDGKMTQGSDKISDTANIVRSKPNLQD